MSLTTRATLPRTSRRLSKKSGASVISTVIISALYKKYDLHDRRPSGIKNSELKANENIWNLHVSLGLSCQKNGRTRPTLNAVLCGPLTDDSRTMGRTVCPLPVGDGLLRDVSVCVNRVKHLSHNYTATNVTLELRGYCAVPSPTVRFPSRDPPRRYLENGWR